MAPVYSTKLAGGRNSGAATPIFTAPATYVTVVRTITLCSLNAGSTFLQLIVAGGEYLLSVPTPTYGVTYTVDGRWVLNAGDVLETFNDGVLLAYSVSGYLLSTP